MISEITTMVIHVEKINGRGRGVSTKNASNLFYSEGSLECIFKFVTVYVTLEYRVVKDS